MNLFDVKEREDILRFFEEARKMALLATCKRAKGGSVIVKDGFIIGAGFNSPPGNLESQRRCDFDKSLLDKKITDKTCCVHAEHRAIVDALIHNHEKISDSRIYYARIDENGMIVKAGDPYCTHCSKFALDVGIREFVLWHEEGIYVYDTEEYNKLSYQYGRK